VDLPNRSRTLPIFIPYLPLLTPLLYSLGCGTPKADPTSQQDAGFTTPNVSFVNDAGYSTDAASPESSEESTSGPASSGAPDSAGITFETRTHTDASNETGDHSVSPKLPENTSGNSSSPTTEPSAPLDGATTNSTTNSISAETSDSGDTEPNSTESAATEPTSNPNDTSSEPPGDTWSTGEGLYAKLVLLLKMNEAEFASDGLVADSSGRGNDATPHGNVTATPDGRFGNGAEFDGTGWLTVPDAHSLRAHSGLTLSAWIRYSPSAPDAAPGIIAKRRGFGQDSAYTLFLWEGNRAFVDVDYENDRFGSNQALEPGVWYHLVVVFDGKRPASERVELYINGVLDTVAHESSSTLPATDSALEIGRLVNGGNTFIGTIDEVAIWTRALSAEEVHTLSETELLAP
jgi:hypothetical protein